ncbi:hypothetical protein PIB30_023729 [Stylosanthes scabra]|uniref:Uncharacterized protein n=1 Tax=Stylosanthes scabra TaxID=79078 RepID=A0ABU6VAF3_9FABA|nr:hypothetical protein [Stylosanthes scabra]
MVLKLGPDRPVEPADHEPAPFPIRQGWRNPRQILSNTKTLTTSFHQPPPAAVRCGGQLRPRHASLPHKSRLGRTASSHRVLILASETPHSHRARTKLLAELQQRSTTATTAVCSPLQVCLLPSLSALYDSDLLVMTNSTNQDVDAGENLPPSANLPASNDTPNAGTPNPLDSNESQSQASSNLRGKTDPAWRYVTLNVVNEKS